MLHKYKHCVILYILNLMEFCFFKSHYIHDTMATVITRSDKLLNCLTNSYNYDNVPVTVIVRVHVSSVYVLIYILTIIVYVVRREEQLTHRQPAQKWRLDGTAFSGHLLYSFFNHAYANRYHYHLVL